MLVGDYLDSWIVMHRNENKSCIEAESERLGTDPRGAGCLRCKNEFSMPFGHTESHASVCSLHSNETSFCNRSISQSPFVPPFVTRLLFGRMHSRDNGDNEHSKYHS